MHRVFKLYEISNGSGFLAIEDERGVPGDLCLTAVGVTELQMQLISAVKPDTFELKLTERDVWIDGESGWLHGIRPFSQILSDF